MENKKYKIMKIIKGILISYIITIILVCIYAFLLTNTNISENTISSIIIIICILSIMLGSFIENRNIKEKGIINGSLIGIGYCLNLYVLSSIFGTEFYISIYSFWMILFCIIAGIIGGIVGVNM